jgi:hypothetical protein
MTTYGYALPYPRQNRFSVWFTGGSIDVNGDSESWRRIFNKEALPRRTVGEESKLLAAKLLMGASTSDEMDENGKISYELNRPLAAYIDLLYLDETLRIMRSSSGAIYVSARVSPKDLDKNRSGNSGGGGRGDPSRSAAAPNMPMRRGDPSRSAAAPSMPMRRGDPNCNAPPKMPVRSSD